MEIMRIESMAKQTDVLLITILFFTNRIVVDTHLYSLTPFFYWLSLKVHARFLLYYLDSVFNMHAYGGDVLIANLDMQYL